MRLACARTGTLQGLRSMTELLDSERLNVYTLACVQMGMLLGLESVAELLEFWRDHAGAAGWRLGEEQVREVLAQRPDFSPQDIHALDLSL